MKKHTGLKRALAWNFVSIALCLVMLIGTTFAWFTDTVLSGANQIVAGNLDVELYHSNNTVIDEIVQKNTPLFVNHNEEGNSEAILWEPGAIVYENFKVANVGSLALKYKMTLNVIGSNTIKDTQKSLKDVLKVAVVDGTFSGSRENAAALTFDKTLADFEKEGHLLSGKAENSDTYGIVIYWEPSAADNDYNLNNGRQSSDGEPFYIDLSINLIAAQDTVESDSFNNQYDASAWDALMEETNKNTLAVTSTSASEYFEIHPFDTEDSKLMSVAFGDSIGPESIYRNALTFTVTGQASKDMQLTFDFGKKCSAGESYKGHTFEYGFGGYHDIYMPAGAYSYDNGSLVAFDLVGDYHPFVFTVTPAEGNQNNFSYKGSLPGLVEALSAGFTLKAGVEYSDTFVISVEWPFWSSGTDACHIEQNGIRVSDNFNDIPSGMDLADTYFGMTGANGWDLELCADFEVSIK